MKTLSATSRRPSRRLPNKIVNTNLCRKSLQLNLPPRVAQLHQQLDRVEEMSPNLVMTTPLPPLQASSVPSKNPSPLSAGSSPTMQNRARRLLKTVRFSPQQLPNQVLLPLASHQMSTSLPVQAARAVALAMSAQLHLGRRPVVLRRI
jgi:hypothetical protein